MIGMEINEISMEYLLLVYNTIWFENPCDII